MTIQYLGKNSEWNQGRSSVALITYSEDREQGVANLIFDALDEAGWTIEQEEGCASIEVRDLDEDRELVDFYKDLKKQYRRQ